MWVDMQHPNEQRCVTPNWDFGKTGFHVRKNYVVNESLFIRIMEVKFLKVMWDCKYI